MYLHNLISNSDIVSFKAILAVIFALPIVVIIIFRRELTVFKAAYRMEDSPLPLRIVPSIRLRTSTQGDIIPYGLPISFKAIVYNENGGEYDVTDMVTWHSIKRSVAYLTPAGRLIACKTGKVTIVVSYRYMNKHGVLITTSATKQVDIIDSTIRHVIISGFPYHIKQHATAKMVAHAIYDDGYLVDITHLTKWQSTNHHMISISNEGEMTAHNIGSAHIVGMALGVSSIPERISVDLG